MKFTKYIRYGDYHWSWYYKKKNWRYVRHVNFLKKWVVEKDVIDIGAGDGLIAHILGIRGVDNELSGINMAAKHGVKIDFGDAYHLPYNDGEFESALMSDTIEHLKFTRTALREVLRVIRKYLYIDIPRQEDYYEEFHYYGWTKKEFIKKVEPIGFKLIGKPQTHYDKIYFKFEKL